MAYTTINDPTEYFQTTLYTGNDTDGTQITNSGNSDLKPDWLWIKNRTDGGSVPATGGIWDSTRGFAQDKVLTSFTTNAEGANANGFAVATTNGFTVEDGTSGANPRTATNKNAKNYVAWQWKANGGTTSSNTDGSITSTVQANTTAGFSILTFTGTTSNQTVGHGLNQAPEIFFVKSRASTSNFWVYTTVVDGSLDFLSLNTTNASGTASNSVPTSSVIYQNQTDSSVAYCFHSVEGYSKFGSYTGNYDADGPFVYTGFKPALVITKRSDGPSDWRIADNKRDPFNIVDGRIKPNTSDAEDDSDQFDFLSNGFKVRAAAGDINHNGGTIIYMAFGESPFVSSDGVPTTAR